MSENGLDQQELLHSIASQQRQILTALAGMKPSQEENITFLQADVNAGLQKLEKEQEAQKKIGAIYEKPLPSSRLELIGWKRGSQGIQRFYREIGQ